jgi:pyrophosphatase PpaX
MVIKAILFDLDGVLIDSLKTHYLATNSAIKKMGKSITLKQFTEKYWGTYVEINIRRILGLIPEEKVKELVEVYRKNVNVFMKYTKIYPKVKEVLNILKERNLKLGVVTSSLIDSTERLLKSIGIKEYFDVVVCGDMVENPKPAPDGILKACEMLKVNPKETIYVGDNYHDIEAGRRAGSKIVAITTTLTKEELKDAHFVIDNLEELPDLIIS